MTKEQIEQIKNDPIANLLSSISGMSVDDIIKKFGSDMAPVKDSFKEENKVMDSKDDEPTYPLSVPEFKRLIYTIQNYFRRSYDFRNFGLDIEQIPLWHMSLDIMEDLLEIIFDEETALNIIDQCSDVSEDPDTLTYNIIDYINTRDD